MNAKEKQAIAGRKGRTVKKMQRKCCNCGTLHFGDSDFCTAVCGSVFAEYIATLSSEQRA